MRELVCPRHMCKVPLGKCMEWDIDEVTGERIQCNEKPVMSTTLYWCKQCNVPIYEESCPLCGEKGKYIATDIRPVFPEEKILLAILLEKDDPLCFEELSVWNNTNFYFIDGEKIQVSIKDFNGKTLDEIQKIKKKYDEYSAQIDYSKFDKIVSRFIQANENRYNEVTDEAISFVQEYKERYSLEDMFVSFSGGKDSTVTSDIVRRAFSSNKVYHIFGDTTLEFPSYGQVYFGTIASYGAFSLYGRNDIKNENRLRDMIHKDAIFDDDFDKNEVSRLNDNAKMIYGVMLDYAKAFPNSADNLSIVFIDPSELQPIVAAIYKYIDARRKNNISAKVNISLRILVKPENKGGRNYLAYWMDEFFSQDENVNIHTYLNEWNSKSQLEKLLNGNNDIAFVMDILKVNNLGFVASHSNESLAPSQCRFPIVYKPTPISSTSVKRTIELSQPQFKAAYEHTQIVRYRNNMEKIPDEMYIASKEVSIDSDGQAIVHFLHEKAYWVVCVDSGMDGALLRSDDVHQQDYNIIGFSTGKGAYGQYNLTITTRKTILETIRKKLEDRLYSLFKWDKEQIKKAAQLCIDEASGLDGISLLSAINPKDENIREFLAYILTSLREEKSYSDSVLKIVIHLDSYKHWFDGDIDKDDDSSASRPDFLVLEAFFTDDEKLKLKATVTECKTSIYANAEQHKNHALEQVKHGVRRLSKIFNPNSKSIKRRYWYAQLYRALAFAQVTFSNNTSEFAEVSSRLRSILDGNYEIEWNSRILGFWIDMPGDNETENISDDGIMICDIPQKIIQSFLLGNEVSDVNFVNINAKDFIEDDEVQERIKERERVLAEEIESSQNGKIKRMQFAETYSSVNKDDVISEDVPHEKAKVASENVSVNSTNEETETLNLDETIESHNLSDEASEVAHSDSHQSIKTDVIENKDSLENIRVLIGKNKMSTDVYWEFGSPQMANRHLLITGTSGQGKTYSIQTMLYELAKGNVSSVVFDYTEGFRLDQLEPEFVDSMHNKINQHIVKIQGVPINPFKRQEQDFAGMKIQDTPADVAGRFANILTHVYGFGEQQYAAIYEATRVGS